MASRFKNKVRQVLYKPGKSKYLNSNTIKSIKEIEKALDEGLKAFIGKKTSAKKDDKDKSGNNKDKED